MAEHEYRVIIPKQDNDQQRISVELLEGLVREYADHFRGTTVYPKLGGCYKLEELYGGGMICEPNLMVASVRRHDTPAEKVADDIFVADFARRVGRLLGQESVFEQVRTDTLTILQPGHPQQRLPAALLQQGPPPATTFARLLAE